MIERRNHHGALRRGIVERGAVAVVEIVADETDLDIVAAEGARLVDLLLRRRHRHEDHALLAEVPAHEGHALRVVAGRRADERPVDAFRQAFANEVESAANLVGSHRGEILPLQEDARSGPGAKEHVFLQRRFGEELAHRDGGGGDG